MGKSDKKTLYTKLYRESPSFKLFVDKNAKSYGKTLEELWEDKIVQSYAEYIMNDKPKEVRSEVKKNCGC